MKKVLFSLLVSFSISMAGAYAQNLNHPKSGETLTKTPTISTSDIQYWIGTGSNEAILVVSWDEASPAQSLAWGYRWNGSITAADMLTAIDNADTRLSITGVSSGFIDEISYSDATYNLSTELWWCYTVNGSYASGVSSQAISNGDVMEFSDGCAFTATTATPVPEPNGSTGGGNDDDNDTILLADATISADSIIYWIGQGDNEVVLAINWNNPDTALAWGFRFDQDSVTVKTIIDSIVSNDYRLAYTPNAYGITDITYTDSSTILSTTTGSYWIYNINGIGAMLGYDQQYVKNGEFVKWGDLACASIADSVVIDDPTYGSYTSYSYVWLKEITPVTVPEERPEDPNIPVITPEEIVYWVGEGDNQAILTANFVMNQTAEEYIGLAWGYRWSSTDSITVAAMLQAIDNADDRFAVTLNNGSINTMSYTDNNYTLSLTTEGYAMYSVNGTFPYDYCNAYVVSNGDVVTVGDYFCGGYTEDTYEGYWKELTTQPVSNPNLNRFCGIVGSEGCTAVHYQDSRIKNWATACTVERGYMDIAEQGERASFGNEANAVGPAGETTTNAISLGDGGYAILTFEKPIINGEGFDFAVYENSFNDYFLELAFVEVSSDGVNFVRFPATSLTPTDQQVRGDGTIDATNINNLAGKYRVGWGTPFDLEELRDSANININNITHVKIIDVVGTIDPQHATYDAFGNIVNDPYPTNINSGGFDLTGVCVLNEKVSIHENMADINIKLYPNPCRNYINIENVNTKNILVYNVYGQLIAEYTATSDSFIINTQTWQRGVYVLKIDGQCCRIVKE